MIALSVAGTEIQLKINGKELPPANNFFKSFILNAGFGYSTPAIEFLFEDRNRILSGPLALVDGSKITLTYSFSDKPKLELNFTTVSCKEQEIAGAGISYDIVAVLGAPSYVFGAQQEAKKGTSVDAVRQILEAHGITVDSDVTSDDSMTWLNVGKSRAMFVQDILSRSFKDTESVITGLHDVDNTFIIRELFSTIQKDPEYTIVLGDMPEKKEENTFFALEHKPFKHSGLTNLMFNYGHVKTQSRADGKIDTYESVNPPVIQDGLPINQEVRNSFAYSTSASAKYYDSGIGKNLSGSNAHEKYYEAKTQNMRYLSLFNSGIRVNIPKMANIPMFSIVEVKAFNQFQELDVQETVQGIYIVGGKTIACVGNNYREFYALYRCFVTQSGNTPLLGSKNQRSDSKKPKMDKADSVVDYNDPLKAQSISQQASTTLAGGDTQTPAQAADAAQQNIKTGFDGFIDKATGSIDDLENSFASESGRFGFGALSDKYSAGKDQMLSLLSEFSMAKSILENCGELNPLESLVIDFIKLNLDDLVNAVLDRIDRIDGLSARLLNEINALLALGDLNGGYLKAPQLNVSCRAFAQDHLNAALRGLYPDQCIDNFNMNRLRFPFNKLNRLKRLLLSFLRDLLCALGENATE